jgi:tetratricopeptide (TPR) repeat protein
MLNAQRPLRKTRLQKIALYLRDNRVDLAEKDLTEYLSRLPDDADAIELMAKTQIRLGRRSHATALLERCLELAPDLVPARFNLANLLFQLGRFEAALNEIDRLLHDDGNNPVFRQLKAGILGNIGEDDQALIIWQQLVAEVPTRPISWVNYGHALRATGNREKSIAAYRKAIDLRSHCGLAWWGLANMKTVRFSNSDIAAMQEQLMRHDITADDRTNILFALGKAYEDLHAYKRSYEYYARANAAMRLRIDFDADAARARLVRDKALFTPDFFRHRSGAGCKAPDPIFIVGQPRSGSTLIEQILSSHSAIEGTAELPYVAALTLRLQERECAAYGVGYPDVLAKLDHSTFAALGEEYMRSARMHRKLDRPFFIDKSPNNYRYIGIIQLMLPNARIIDARRNPAACCLSMFKQNFSKNNLRPNELGGVYRDYVELMAHFDRVLPGKIHRTIYEDLVSNLETEIRLLLHYLDLPFEESCLRFHETERAVHTPSSEQVRKPISGEAVDHWRHYEPWLGPLIKSLGSVFAAYPSVPGELQ